jgi:mRNA interferase HigB
MRVIALKALRDFWLNHADAETALRAWCADAYKAYWSRPEDIKRTYRNASILPNNRVVFNIRGNTYRLVVSVSYATGIVYIRFIGTHAEYDRVDATAI